MCKREESAKREVGASVLPVGSVVRVQRLLCTLSFGLVQLWFGVSRV